MKNGKQSEPKKEKGNHRIPKPDGNKIYQSETGILLYKEVKAAQRTTVKNIWKVSGEAMEK